MADTRKETSTATGQTWQSRCYTANIEVFVRGNSTSISTGGLSIEDELKEDPDTDKETIVNNWIEADVERIQAVLGSELLFNEKEKLEEELESYYYRYKDK